MLLPLLALGQGLVAAQEERDFDIPAGPLADTLLRICQVADVMLSYAPELVQPHTAPAIRGRFTLKQAMSLALQPSALVAETLDAGILTIREVANRAGERKPEDGAGAAGVSASGAGSASAGGPITVLPRVVVRGLGLPRNDDGLRGLRSWSATRSDTPLVELPQAVSVLTPEALDLQGGTTSADALGYVSGLTEILDILGSGARFMPDQQVRGFAAASALSGMRTNRRAIPLDTAFIERIEVPKGPSGVVTGMAGLGSAFVSELGGTINMERKQAGPDTPVRMTQTADSSDGGTLHFTGDVGGAWLGGTQWRIVSFANRSGETDGGYEGKSGAGLLGSLRWLHGPLSAGLTLQLDGSRDVPAPSSRGGLRAQDGGNLAVVPLEPGVAEPLNPKDRLQTRGSDLDLDLGWQLTPKWRVDWRGRVELVRTEWGRHELLFQPLTVSSTNWLRVVQLNLTGEFATGPATHRMLLGFDGQRSRGLDSLVIRQGMPLVSDIVEHRRGLLWQDQISLGRWRLRLAVQRAGITGLDAVVRNQPVEVVGSQAGTNGDVGLLFQVRPSLAFYGGVQSTIEAGQFSPDQVTLPDGSLRPPARMTQAQLGLKMNFPDLHTALSAEVYRLRKFNTTRQTAEGLTLLPGRYVNGLELELTGRPYPNLEFILGYTVMRARDVNYEGDTPATLVSVESRTAGIPRRSLQVLARLHLPAQVLANTTLGIGLRAASDMLVGIPGSSLGIGVRTSDYVLPGGGQLDVSLERQLGPWSVKAFVRNLTDQQLYMPTYEVSYLPLRPARHLGLSLAYTE